MFYIVMHIHIMNINFFVLDGPLRLSDDGFCVLKPVQRPPKGEREVLFYKRVFQDDEDQEEILELRRFLPHYYGVVELSILNDAIIIIIIIDANAID